MENILDVRSLFAVSSILSMRCEERNGLSAHWRSITVDEMKSSYGDHMYEVGYLDDPVAAWIIQYEGGIASVIEDGNQFVVTVTIWNELPYQVIWYKTESSLAWAMACAEDKLGIPVPSLGDVKDLLQAIGETRLVSICKAFELSPRDDSEEKEILKRFGLVDETTFGLIFTDEAVRALTGLYSPALVARSHKSDFYTYK